MSSNSSFKMQLLKTAGLKTAFVAHMDCKPLFPMLIIILFSSLQNPRDFVHCFLLNKLKSNFYIAKLDHLQILEVCRSMQFRNHGRPLPPKQALLPCSVSGLYVSIFKMAFALLAQTSKLGKEDCWVQLQVMKEGNLLQLETFLCLVELAFLPLSIQLSLYL